MHFLFFLFFYLVLYYPVIESVSALNSLLYLAISLIIIFLKPKTARKIAVKLSFVRNSTICLFCYVLVLVLFAHADMIVLKALFRSVIIPIFNVIALCTLTVGKKRKDIMQDVITIGIIASILSLLLYFVPSVAQHIRNLTGATEQLGMDTRDRGYGIASSLFSGYPLIQGWCAYLCLIYDKSRFKYIKFLLLLISITLNARTPLFILVGMIVIHYLLFSSARQFVKTGMIIVGCILLIVLTGVYELFSDKIDFVLEAYYLTSDFLLHTSYGDGSGHFTGLADTFLIWPRGVYEWIFGNGLYLLFGSPRGNSDVGFIIQLNYGGFIYLVLLAFPILYVIWQQYKFKNWETFILLVLTVCLLDWKGDLFLQTNLQFLVLLLYVRSGIFKKNGYLCYANIKRRCVKHAGCRKGRVRLRERRDCESNSSECNNGLNSNGLDSNNEAVSNRDQKLRLRQLKNFQKE